MLFTQIEFVVFLLAILTALWLLGRGAASGSDEPRPAPSQDGTAPRDQLQKALLLVASYYFYAYWDWRFVGLIIFSTLVDYWIGRALTNVASATPRRALLLASLGANLGLLATFKYYDFFVRSAQESFAFLGLELGTLNLILPIGISFYTFQTLSYTIDLYRQRIEPCPSLLDFALFVAFFPQLVAGPIVRAAEFLPQLRRPLVRNRVDLFVGTRQFVIGLFKKVFVADNLARFVDEVFANAGAYDTATTWLAVAAYAIQIYCDFSGYSDMAIGTARVLGFRFDTNFDFPYLARSMSDFWRRWHISLSSWLRDYLYIPLGGNRRGPGRTQINLMLTMLLGGLWHGAAWTFVAWGAIHGAALVIQRGLVSIGGGTRWGAGSMGKIAARLATLVVVLVAWVFFRAASFDSAGRMLGAMFHVDGVQPDGGGIAWPFPFAIAMVVLTIAVHGIQLSGHGAVLRLPGNRWRTPILLCTMVWLVLLYHPTAFSPFIYFQF